jgi:hypothetical protein
MVTVPLLAYPWFADVATVTVVPDLPTLAFDLRTPATVEVPAALAEVEGLTGAANVNVVVVGTDAMVNVPLYSVWVAPDSVIVPPVSKP